MPRQILRMISILLLSLSLLLPAAAAAAATPAATTAAPYIGQADIDGEQIVFTAEDDLWSCNRQGGDARRLTTHAGVEYFPHIAPDGGLIAFTGEYDGNRDVYVIPFAGGEPRRLTWHPVRDEVVGWLPGGKIVFRSQRHDPHGDWHLWTVSPAGADPEVVPLGPATRLDVDPASGRWAFNRLERERATWKRYRGGTAADIWVGHPERGDYRRITNFAGPDAFPMWHAGRIYFLSDEGGTANLWCCEADGSGRTQLTDLKDWDARWPAMGPAGTIVFTAGADLHVFEPETRRLERVAIDLPSDRTMTRTRYRASSRDLQGFDLSPDGERLLVEVRGELFSVPVQDGVTLPITRGTGARERDAVFSHDGQHVVYWCDATREDALHRKDAWGRGGETVVRQPASGPWAWAPYPSPDGRWLAWSDSDSRLLLLSSDGKTEREIDRGEHGRIDDLAWSADGRWLAYVKELPNDHSSVFIYDTVDRISREVSGAATIDRSPAWDPEGRYLWFVSARATNPVLGNTDFQVVEVQNLRLYGLVLRRDAASPLRQDAGLPPAAAGQSDRADKAKAKDKDKAGEDKKPAPVVIDFEGLTERVVELPIDRGRYGGLAATASHVYYLSRPVQGMAEGPDVFEEPEPSAVLMVYDLKEREAKPFVSGVAAYRLRTEAGKLAIMKKRGEFFVVDAGAPPGDGLAKGKVKLDDAVVELEPRAEWRQVYWEAWRQMRAFYWDADLAGLNWPGLGEQYGGLLPRVASRADLSDLIGELYGEVNTSHAYVWGGGESGQQAVSVATGLLGAEFERVAEAYRVARILRGDVADLVRSPLDEPGVDAGEGDFILAVNGRPVTSAPNLHALLAGLAGKQVLLTVADDQRGQDRREVLVTPLRSERELRYADWVRRNREYVAVQTGGRIGYVHVPDMGTDGMVAFNRWFYPQLDKEGLIVDVRWNGGGFVSQLLLERLRRPVVAFDRHRNRAVATYPNRVLNGPFVVLTNERAGSDGDIFPQAVQLENLAPVIGVRSWGGVIGITGVHPLQDGGIVTQPIVAWWDPRQGWGVENHGVDPDIVVENLPQDLARGRDAQLEQGIAEVLRLHQERPPLVPAFEPVPARSRQAYREREMR
ncbi:MAG: S41 family peptidase [Candidatus Krumholzibacteria bacterium]|nr:S41 family peptidase [Candidatus Krumholzibacteria bacterium]